MWGDIALWFWFTFLWWLEMMSILPHACWPSVYLLWKMFGFLILNCLSCLCILNINHCWSYNLTNAFSQLFDIQKIFLILVCNHDVRLLCNCLEHCWGTRKCVSKEKDRSAWVFIRIVCSPAKQFIFVYTWALWENSRLEH